MPTAATAAVNGDLVWRYMRQWMIQADASTNLKTITVRTTARRTVGSVAAPFVVLVGFKSR